MGIPRSTAPWYRRRENYVFVSELVLVFGAGWIALKTGYSKDGLTSLMTMSAAPSDLVIIAGVPKATFTLQDKWRESRTHDLEGCLHTLRDEALGREAPIHGRRERHHCR